MFWLYTTRMIIGITGTRYGFTQSQRKSFDSWLEGRVPPDQFHHGSCKGVDVQAARTVCGWNPACHIIAHPGPDGDRCRELSGVDDETRPPLTHFARNRNIVDECEVLVACPREMSRQSRGGTWYTVGYSEKKGRQLVLILPDGSIHNSVPPI